MLVHGVEDKICSERCTGSPVFEPAAGCLHQGLPAPAVLSSALFIFFIFSQLHFSGICRSTSFSSGFLRAFFNRIVLSSFFRQVAFLQLLVFYHVAFSASPVAFHYSFFAADAGGGFNNAFTFSVYRQVWHL